MQTDNKINSNTVVDPTIVVIKYLRVAMRVVLVGIISTLVIYYISEFINVPASHIVLQVLEYSLFIVIISYPAVISLLLLITYIVNRNKRGVLLGSGILISLIISFVSAIIIER